MRDDGLIWLVVVNGWSSSVADLVNSGRVDGVELNSSKGSWDESLRFLSDVPGLRHLTLIDLAAKDVGALQTLANLEGLTLSAYSKSPIDFGRMPRLRKAFIEWRKQYRNLSSCVLLEDLYINRYTGRDLRVVDPMRHMVRLRVGDSRTVSNLSGIEKLTHLRAIGIYGLPQLRSLEPLTDRADSLEDVDINQCRHLSSIEPLGQLKSLKRLVLADCGKVPSIRPVAQCHQLRQFFFYGDTNVADGDFDFLRQMPLADISFMNRRHYSLRREELPGFKP